MAKKLFLLITAMATISFAAPAMASAAPVLTMPTSVIVAPGTKVTLTSNDWVMTFNNHAYPCHEPVVWYGVVSGDSPGIGITMNGTGVPTSAPCTWLGLPLTFEDFTLSELSIKEAGKGTASFSYKIPASGNGCPYTAKNVPLTYTAGTNSFKFSAVTVSPVPLACGTVKLDADFTVVTTAAPTSGPVIID
jgi:hypothetical protein